MNDLHFDTFHHYRIHRHLFGNNMSIFLCNVLSHKILFRFHIYGILIFLLFSLL